MHSGFLTLDGLNFDARYTQTFFENILHVKIMLCCGLIEAIKHQIHHRESIQVYRLEKANKNNEQH
jgi:hypothetical protein